MALRYLIIRPLGDGDLSDVGPVESTHRTLRGAHREWTRRQRRCRRDNGPGTWADLLIIASRNGVRRHLDQDEEDVLFDLTEEASL